MRNAEIHHQCMAVFFDHDVLGLQIPMHHTDRVRRLQSLAHLTHDRHGFRPW